MKKHQIMIISSAILALSCHNALAESCGEGCSYTLTTAEDGHTIATIDNTTTSIPENAFRNRRDIKEVIIPDSVTSIGDNAFSGMFIDNITIGKNIESIGYQAFASGMRSLQNLTIPDSVTTIGDYAFDQMWNLQSLTIPDSITTIGRGAFAGMQNLQSLTIPDSVTSIGESAFEGMWNLTNLTIPDSVTSIGILAFGDMYNVTSLTIPNSVTTIGANAFWNMWSLQSLTIPDSVTSIGQGAFQNMESLQSLTIPDSATSISQNAFLSMNGNAQIYCEGNMCDMLESNRSFYGLDSQTLIPYTKGENGVYEIDGVFYSSSENMQAGISCGSQAACAEEIKNAHQTSSSEPSHIVRRIYTVEEATEAVSGKGKNTFTIRYR